MSRKGEGEGAVSIPIDCNLQASVGTAVDGFAKVVNDFSIHS